MSPARRDRASAGAPPGPRALRVLHLSTFDTRGGAGRAALRLHRALRARGVESRMLVQRRFGEEPGVDGPRGGPAGFVARLRPRLESLPVRLHPGRSRLLFSPSFLPDGTGPRVRAARPDVIHVHWVGFGFLRPETVASFTAPVLWTLHDSWVFTGGCHLPGACTRYRDACGACPALGSSRPRDLSSRVFERKRRAFGARPPSLVSPSRWLADAARSSALFRDASVAVIPNGVDLAAFRPADREEARRALGLPEDRFILFFSGLEGLEDPNKGFPLLKEALDRAAAGGLADRLLLLVAGLDRPVAPPDCAAPIRFEGRLDRDSDVALRLAAADALALPSRVENQPNLVTEAMAASRPTLAFRATGLPELVEHRVTGYLADPYRVDDLAAGIAWLAEDAKRTAALGDRARERAERGYGVERTAERYLELYRALAPDRIVIDSHRCASYS